MPWYRTNIILPQVLELSRRNIIPKELVKLIFLIIELKKFLIASLISHVKQLFIIIFWHLSNTQRHFLSEYIKLAN